MFVQVNGARLYVDVEGMGLVPRGPRMVEKPTVILLHGGPGFDHTNYKPAFSALAEVAQLIYVDHRGNGRSVGTDPGTWNLAQWGDDVKGLCDALGIEKPIIYGQSFGGFVAQSYATRHPDHPAKVILASTAARIDFHVVFDAFERVGGKEARRIAEDFWLRPSHESRQIYIERCHPLYHPKPFDDPDAKARRIVNTDVVLHFNGPGRELMGMDFRPELAKMRCPVLITCGDQDPITPMAFSDELAASLPPHLVRVERFAACGHGVHIDEPERAFALYREFITGERPA
jgi:pimeloyl-ACP methyl ester carboxylesterase